MRNSQTFRSIWVGAAILAAIGALLFFTPALADVAPPESPPGVVISPGSETTQVRMLSETVTLTVLPGVEKGGKAGTAADFVMRNLGSADENMNVRFPLTYGEALYSPGAYPEINDFKVMVNGAPVSTTRTTSLDANSGSAIPWASFPVKFPVGQDVRISVTYTATGFGYDPLLTFRYILETGAGWKGSIGSGDIILRLPYAASQQNILGGSDSAFSQVAGGPYFSGDEARWHFDNLEPTPDQNFQVQMIAPAFWNNILAWRENTSKNPQDGEAWGQLGKAIKLAIRNPKGDLRTDTGSQQLYAEADQAYQKAVSLLPKDEQWHYGYADLLWSHYLFGVYYQGQQDNAEISKLAAQLQASLQLKPDYQEARDLAANVALTLPWAISDTGQSYDFLVLTATPTSVAEPVPTFTPAPSSTPTHGIPSPAVDEFASPTAPIPPAQPAPQNPLCGSVLLIPFLFGLLWLVSRRRP